MKWKTKVRTHPWHIYPCFYVTKPNLYGNINIYGNDRKYKMIIKILRILIDKSELTIIPISSQKYKKASFYLCVTAFHEVPLTPLFFNVTQHHEKRWDPHTHYAWHNYLTTSTYKTLCLYKKECTHQTFLCWPNCKMFKLSPNRIS